MNRLVLTIIIFIGAIIFYTLQDNDQEFQNELIATWGEETINFKNTVDFDNLKYRKDNYKIEKFIMLHSDENGKLYLTDISINESLIPVKKFYTKKISEANVIVLLKTIKGINNETVKYRDGSTATRGEVEVSLIKKDDMTVFYKERIDFIGDAPNEIRLRTNEPPKHFQFGIIPFDVVERIINKYC